MIILALFASFFIIFYLMLKNYSLGGAILGGALALSILAGLPIGRIVDIGWSTLLNSATHELVINILLISILGSMMHVYGVTNSLVHHLNKTFRNPKHLLFIVPSLLSAFTAPGSAIVAAPVIEALGSSVGLTPARKAAINLYIRHVWYFVIPISVPLIYASRLANVSILELIAVQAPVTLVGLIVGYLVYIKPIKYVAPMASEETGSKRQHVLKSVLYSSPLWLSVALVIWLPFNMALLTGCIVTYLIRTKEGIIKEALINKLTWTMAYAAISIMFYKTIIDNLPGIKIVIENIIAMGISIEFMLITTPFILGLIMANPWAVVGSLYPLFLPLVPPEQVIATAMIIFTQGFLGYFISPVHLCQALTNEYFQVNNKDLYREYKITLPFILLATIITYTVLRIIA